MSFDRVYFKCIRKRQKLTIESTRTGKPRQSDPGLADFGSLAVGRQEKNYIYLRMIFEADQGAINSFLEYFQFDKWLLKPGLFAFLVIIIVSSYYQDGIPGLTIMLIASPIILYGNIVRPFFNFSMFCYLRDIV